MDLSAEAIQRFIIYFPIILISVALHEFAHCWTNDRLGDDTPRRLGRITLNPFAHLSPMGTIMMAVSSLSGFGFGWGKPSPFDPANFRHPARDRMIGAMAGPLSNILQMFAWASIALLLNTFVHDQQSPAAQLALNACWYGITINAGLAVFNLLPIYPLDGHHLLSYLLPRWRHIIDNPAWTAVFLVMVLYRPLWHVICSVIIFPVLGGLISLTSLIVGCS